MDAGVVKSTAGFENITWNILGQTYVPKQMTEPCFSWHATFPPGTFVPPHIHPDQDEFLYILEGRFDFILNGEEAFGEPGDLITLPRGIPHGIFNKSDQTIKTLFWVTPTHKLYDLFWRSEEHTSELQSRPHISYAVFCLKKKKNKHHHHNSYIHFNPTPFNTTIFPSS